MSGLGWRKILSFLVLMGLLASRSHAQETATVQISGVVTDPTGAAIAGVRVTVTEVQTGFLRSTTTSNDGSYLLTLLPVGHYQIEAKANGFSTYLQRGIILTINTNPTVNIVLQVGTMAQTVEVQADASMVETHQTAISQVMEQRRIVDLPLNGRQATDLILLSGASAPTAHGDMVSSKNYPTSVTISVAGGQGNGNNYLLDGSDNNDAFSNVNLPFPFPDAMQEFSVQTSSQSAQYGLHPGSVVNVVTKSGTNQFHGDVFEFLRNGAVNATNFFAKSVDTLKRNQFGGTIGGPIVHNKLLFFGGYQGTRLRQAPPTTLVHVLTPQAMSGDFSTLESQTCTGVTGGRALNNPSGGKFAGDFIDPKTWNAQAVNLLKLVPVSSDPCGVTRIGIPNIEDEDQFIGRVDWLQSSKHTVFGRYFLTDLRNPATFDGSNILTTTQPGVLPRSQTVALGDTYNFTPTSINTLHLTFSRLRINRGPAPNLINPTQLGVNIDSLVPNFVNMSVSSHFDVGCGTCSPGHFNDNSWQVADDVVFVRGNHELAFGGEVIHNQLNELSNFKSNGQFTFNGTFTGDPIADLVLGIPSDFTQGDAEQENWRQTYYSLYVQDNYRLSRRLTLIGGIRWEPFLPTVDKFGRGNHFDLSAFQAGTKSTIYANSPIGLFFKGDPQTPDAYTNRRLADFDPRIGIVWDPTGSGRQSIRAGYGIFYDEPEIFYFDRFADSAPFGSSIDIPSPAGGFTNPYQGFPGGSPFPLPFPPTSSQTFPTAGVYINLPTNVRPTYVQQWNLAYQRQVGQDWLFSVGYLGNKTTHLWLGTEQNPAIFIPGESAASTGCAKDKTTGLFPNSCTGNTNKRRELSQLGQQLFPTGFPAGSGVNPGSLYSTIALLNDGVNAEYNALLVTANHRFSQNFTVLANYTYSHCIDGGDFTGELAGPNFQNPADPGADRANCGFDRRHTFNASLVAQMPRFQRNMERLLFSGWEGTAIFTAESGGWFNLTTGTDQSLTGVNNDRPNLVGNPNSGSCAPPKGQTTGAPVGTLACWFNATAFVANSPGTFGNVGRNALVGPARWDMDAGIVRSFRVRESQNLQMRFEAFDVFNHPRFQNPQGSLKSSQFGQITGADDPRILQLAVKYVF